MIDHQHVSIFGSPMYLSRATRWTWTAQKPAYMKELQIGQRQHVPCSDTGVTKCQFVHSDFLIPTQNAISYLKSGVQNLNLSKALRWPWAVDWAISRQQIIIFNLTYVPKLRITTKWSYGLLKQGGCRMAISRKCSRQGCTMLTTL